MTNRRILVPVDLMRGTTEALRAVQQMARDSVLSVTLLHVIELNIVPHERVYDQLRTESEAALRKLAWLFFGSDEAVRTSIRIGDTAEQIVQQATDDQSHVIVLTRSKGRRRLFRTGIILKVLDSAPCATLVLQPAKSSGTSRQQLAVAPEIGVVTDASEQVAAA